MTLDGAELAHTRWASPEMLALFGRASTTMWYHRIWLQVLRAQIDAGVVPDPDRKIYDGYAKVALRYASDEPSIRAIYDRRVDEAERRTRHDLKAHLEVFDWYAGNPGKVHLGMTSSDVTEVTWQAQVMSATDLLHDRLQQVTQMLADRVKQHLGTPIVARTHGQPAQVTTLGKRLADLLHELELAEHHLADQQDTYHRRAVVGAVGNHGDMLELLRRRQIGGERTRQLLTQLSRVGDLPDSYPPLRSVGQSYPRLLDSGIAGACVTVAAALARLGITVRLMATLEQAWEHPSDGQVGSSAMPHKNNPRYSERLAGLHQVVVGYHAMLAQAAAGQWLEGDVANSCVRRVAVPGVFYATDGALATAAHLLRTIEWRGPAIDQDLRRHAPYLATGRLLSLAVSRGANREKAHQRLREHALAAWEQLSRGGSETLAVRVGDDPQLPIASDEVDRLAEQVADDPGMAQRLAELAVAHHVAPVDWDPEVR